ncbi:hypothetical protein CMT41_18070 [Colwellia sp. MT41]|uniref:InlB B-repeat-containing protein n=1 Tax=Colwellia sp. MT41 TaxID=58049 RepID=UPI000717B106|nr:InlB B-repeat-containing protein [Colwellia sp. MT41]ALO36436.1 hypothetical protein CMT41_18070 [Colwellia sp. MT41]
MINKLLNKVCGIFNMNMDITSMLRTIVFISLSFLLISCSPDEETPVTNLLPNFYDLEIKFIQAEQDLGVINIQPSNLVCKTTCTSNIAADTVVELIATPKAGVVFVEWGGDCTGSTACQVTMSSAHSVTASFAAAPSTFALSLQITSGGSITLADKLGECFADCQLSFANKELLTLTATPETGYTFTGWSGDCTGDTTCQVTMTAAHSITTTFTEIPLYSLTTSISIGGSISLKDGSLTCAAETDCSFNIVENEAVVIKPLPAAGFIFTGWNGDCTGSSSCELTMSAKHSLTANFIKISTGELLSLTISAGGSIVLADNLGECFADCQLSFANKELLTLTATPETGYTFTGWSGDCTGDTTCQVTMTAAHSITTTFTEIPLYSLTTSISIGGSISLKDGSLTCAAETDCSFNILESETLTATATPEAGYTFTGWSGDCTGDTTCQVTMSAARSITATFIEIPTETTLKVIVDTGGSITLSDNLSDCEIGCELTFTLQELITLTATAEAGYVFYGWSGDCAGDANCLVNMSSNQTVKAIFKPTSHSCIAQASLPANSFDADAEFAYHNPANDGSKYETLLTDFIVKESSGKGATNYPVSMVFPVEQGLFFHPGDFHIKNSAGEVIPAQFNVINRWWAKDRSLRHIQAHFNVDIEAYTVGQADTGIQTFNLYSGNGNIKPNYSVCTTETDTEILLDNGLVDIKITKSPLTITTPAGQLKSLFIKENGDSDYSFDHDNIKIELEEIGYLRTIVKISSLTNYVSPTDIKHGWAIRLYMYANTDKVKVDFQLQNSAINTALSAPLYFQSHILRIDNAQVSTNQSIKADVMPLADIENLPLGIIHSDNLNVILRNFWQTFPNGLSTHTEGNINIELWPDWSKQFLSRRFYDPDYWLGFVDPEIYWLDDMKQTYKEILFDFSGQNNVDYLQKIAKTFQYPPVAVIPQAYYAKTKVTVDYGGIFPKSALPIIGSRVPTYNGEYYDTESYGGYRFGMDNFGLDTHRKLQTNMTGGVPYTRQHFFVSGSPVDFYNAQDFAQAELNIRPQWLSGYKDELHFNILTPSTNPYGGNTWRRFLGHSVPTSTRDYLTGTYRTANPRDDQHAWFYHVEHAYLMSGNKWIKDWYEFMAEFKKIYLSEKDPWPDRSHRAEGEALAVALAAYRYTDNQTLKPLIENYISDVHNKHIEQPHFIKPDYGKIAAYQMGYLLREFIGIYNEFPENPSTIETIRNYIQWNYKYGQFSYYKSTTDYIVSPSTAPASLSLVDSVIWFGLKTKEQQYTDHAIEFVEVGINNTKPYGKWDSWVGQFEAPMYRYYKQNIE